MSSVGYSGKPLHEKLGFKGGHTIATVHAPTNYGALLGKAAADLRLTSRLPKHADAVHLFATRRADLAKQLPAILKVIQPDGMIWVSWPKKAAGVATDLTEDVIRDVALPMGLVDVKVCAVDEVWSGLKLVIRKANR